MAEAFLKDTKVASSTDDRYQLVVHVDSDVLSQMVFEQPWSACGDEMDYAMALYNLACANREQHGSHV